MTEYMLEQAKLQKFYDDKLMTDLMPEYKHIEILAMNLERVKQLN
jgi:hypothetical protein